MMSKYNNVKTEYCGLKFDSKKELERYKELRLMETAELIEDLILQPRFELQPTFKKNGVTHRSIVYVADFQYFEGYTGKTVVEDVKGMKTDVYKLKKKMFEYMYPNLELKEV